MTRSISHSEASVLLDCQAKHDFAYGEQLAGSSLKPRTTHLRLREGKAWGRAMAVYHTDGDTNAAHTAIIASLDEDAAHALYEPEERDDTETKLHTMLDDYAGTVEPIGITRPEHPLGVSIPSRNGTRASNYYRFTGFLDGVQTDTHGKDWIVEFKLRSTLSSVEQVVMSRQLRWYAWAWREQTGRDVAGILVEERLNAIPKPARILQSGLPSHAKDQLTTPGLYADACRDAGLEPNIDTIAALAARRWQERHVVFLRPWEVDEAGAQLVSVARQAAQFDSGILFPVRNPSQFRCPSCAYRDVCATPNDAELVDALYERVPAKKNREKAAA